MSLLAPGWLALLLLGIPIVLLHRRRARPRLRPVGNLFIWRRVAQEHPPHPQRTLPSLLLILQLGSLAAASLALARPVLLLPEGERPAIHVVLDGSASMMAPSGEGTRFQAALEHLEVQTDRFRDASYTLLLAQGTHPRVMAQAVDRATLLREARQLSPAFVPVSWNEAGRLLGSLPEAPDQVWLLSDGQDEGLERLRAALDGSGREAAVSLLSAGEPLPNRAVTALSARPSGSSLDRYGVLVEVSNASDASTRVRLTLSLHPLDSRDGRPPRVVVDQEVEVGARDRLQLQRELALPAEGEWILRARIDPGDAFPMDDQADVVVLPPRPTLVYLVSRRGDPWLRAFRALPEVAITWRQALPSQPPDGYDLVVYDGFLPDRLPPAASVVVPPEDGGEPGATGSGPPFPGGPAGGGAAFPWSLFYGPSNPSATLPAWWEEDDPLFRFVDWSGTELLAIRPLRSQAGTRVLLEATEGPLMVRLEDPPALLLGFDPARGRLALQPTFPIWVANLVRWANPQAWNRIAPSVSPGELLQPPAPGRLVDRAGETVAEGPWRVDRPGVFRFVPSPSAAPPAAPWVWSSAPLPGPESDLTRVAPSVWIEPEGTDPAPARASARELAHALTLVLGLLLLLEGLLWAGQELLNGPSPAVRLRARWPALVARLAALALVAAAAAGASRVVPSNLGEVWVLLDRSHSIDPALQERAWRWADSLLADAGRRGVGVVLFGDRPAVEQPPTQPGRLPPAPRARVNPQETDLEAALDLVSTQLKPPARIILASDGHATQGDVRTAVDRLRQLGVPVDVLPLAREAPADVAIEQLRVHPQVDPGAPYSVRVTLRAGQAMPARLVLRAAGLPVAEVRVDLPAGSSVFELAARAPEDPQVLPLEVTVEAAQDQRPENNRAEAALRVGEPPRVVVVSQGPSAVAPLLEAQGLAAAGMEPAALPSTPAFWENLDALVLENVPASMLTGGQRRAVARLVRDLGGGLLVVGGPDAYRSGGYHGTELEEILPVALTVPLDVLVPRVAMVLVIDRSGSMGEIQGRATKLDLAKQASLSLLENLGTEDALGILAFDTQASWVLPLGRVGSGAALLQRLAELKPSGGTHLGPALDLAIPALQAVPAVVKHMLILTDGKSSPGPFLEQARSAREAGISLSTVAIGRDADRALLEALARQGGGRYYYTDDVERLPEIFLREVRAVTAPQILEGPHPLAVLEREPFLVGGPAVLQPLERVNAASPREGASLHVATEAGRPVLASWFYGLGRVAAFLSHPSAGWAEEWGSLPALWAQVARWLLPPAAGLQASSLLEITSGSGTLTVDLLDLDGGYVNFARLEGKVEGPDGSTQALRLDQVAPGRYQATFPATVPGAYLATVWQVGPESALPVATASSWMAAAPELALHPRPDPQLYEVARATGGRLLSLEDTLDRVWEPTPGAVARQPLGLPLTLASLVLFLADLALRGSRGRRPA